MLRQRAASWFNVQISALSETTLGFVDEIFNLGHVIHSSLSDVLDVKK